MLKDHGESIHEKYRKPSFPPHAVMEHELQPALNSLLYLLLDTFQPAGLEKSGIPPVLVVVID